MTNTDFSDAQVGRKVNAQPARYPSQEPVLGVHVTLKRLSMAHTEELYACLCGPDTNNLWTHLKVGPFDGISSFRACIQKYIDQTTDRAFYTIFSNETSCAVGYLGLCDIDLPNRTAEIGPVVFGAPLQRTRAATEAIYLLSRLVFEEFGFRRYVWSCSPANRVSGRAAERYGFVYEGLFRQHLIVKGRNRDTAWYSMMDWEWAGVRRGFETWLRDENFDGKGSQKRSLVEIRKLIA